MKILNRNLEFNLNTKLISFFLLMAIIPAAVIGYTSYTNAQSALQEQAFNTLEAVGTLKYNQIESYFGERVGDIFVLSEMPTVIASILAGEGNHEFLSTYKSEYGYYDIFLFDLEGDCFYTVEKEAGYQTNFVSGPYRDSGLGILYRDVQRSRVPEISDFAFYAPRNEPAAFTAN